MDPRYPIGKFAMPPEITPARRRQAIDEIAATPAKLRAAVNGLTERNSTRPIAKADGPFARWFTTCPTAI